MKTTRTLSLLLGFVATFVIISCQKTDLARKQTSESAAPRPPTGSLEPEVVTPTNLPDCNTHCVSEGAYVEAIGYKTQYWGNAGNPHWKTVSYTAYNTATHLVITVTFTH